MYRLLRLGFGLITGALAAMCVLEGTLRLLPVQDGLFIGDPDPAWPAFHFVPNEQFTHSDGWDLDNVTHGSSNNLGYVAPFDYVAGDRAIVIVGDSFVEDAMNSYADSVQGQLASKVHRSEAVMNFGYSGASLADYLGVTSVVRSRFTIDWLVVVIVPGDFVDAFSPEPRFYGWAPGADPPVELRVQNTRSGTVKKVLRSLALVRYVSGQLGGALQALFRYTPGKTAGSCPDAKLEPGDENLIQAVIHSFPAAARIAPSQIVLVFDPDIHPGRNGILRGGRSACTTRDSLARARLAYSAANFGMHVIEMQKTFGDYSTATREPVDHPDSHWNAVGNALVAEKVAEVIDGADPGGS